MTNFLNILLDLVQGYGFLGIFVLMVFENLGFPLPTEIGFVVGQSIVTSGRATYIEVFLFVVLAQTFGSIISYVIGKYFANSIHLIKKPSSKMKHAQEVFAQWMGKYGSAAVFISRLVGYIRPWSSFLAGVGEIKFLPFIFYNIFGTAIITALSMVTLGLATEIFIRYPILRPIAVALFIIFFFGFWIAVWIYQKIKVKNN